MRRQVPLGRPDVAPGLDDEGGDRLGAGASGRHPPVGGAGRHHHVVARAAVEGAERRLEPGGARAEVDDLVARGVAVQTARCGGPGHGQPDVVVGQQDATARHEVAARRQVGGAQVAGEQRLVRAQADVGLGHRLGGHERRRGVAVVQQRGGRREPLGPHQLLGVEPPVGRAELGVTLGRDLTDPSVVRQCVLLSRFGRGSRAFRSWPGPRRSAARRPAPPSSPRPRAGTGARAPRRRRWRSACRRGRRPRPPGLGRRARARPPTRSARPSGRAGPDRLRRR